MVKKYVVVTALAFVSTTGWAQEPQDSIESVDKYLNLKEVVIKGGLPHTRLKGNAMVTRVGVLDCLQRHHVNEVCDLGYNWFKQTNRYSTHKLVTTLIYRFNATRSKYKGTGAGKDVQARMGS